MRLRSSSKDEKRMKPNWIPLVEITAGILKVLITVGLGTLAVTWISENYRLRGVEIAQKQEETKLKIAEAESNAKIEKEKFDLVGKYLEYGLDVDPQKRLWFAEYFASVLCKKEPHECWQSYANKVADYIVEEEQTGETVAALRQEVDANIEKGETPSEETLAALRKAEAELRQLRARLGADERTDSVSRMYDRSLSKLHPGLRKRLKSLLADLNKEEIPFRLFEGFRAPSRQAYLYSAGRSRPGRITTKAKPWRTLHQYGVAADIVPYVDDRWSWDSSGDRAGWWTRMQELAAIHGLKTLPWGKPHVQLVGAKISDLHDGIYPEGGDSSWAENLRSVIDTWSGSPEAPPPPTLPFEVPDKEQNMKGESNYTENAESAMESM
jgi:hypothetical protein